MLSVHTKYMCMYMWFARVVIDCALRLIYYVLLYQHVDAGPLTCIFIHFDMYSRFDVCVCARWHIFGTRMLCFKNVWMSKRLLGIRRMSVRCHALFFIYLHREWALAYNTNRNVINYEYVRWKFRWIRPFFLRKQRVHTRNRLIWHSVLCLCIDIEYITILSYWD